MYQLHLQLRRVLDQPRPDVHDLGHWNRQGDQRRQSRCEHLVGQHAAEFVRRLAAKLLILGAHPVTEQSPVFKKDEQPLGDVSVVL